MEEVDLFIAGGGIGGSVTAKFAAMGGLDVLFVERCETPRHKPCSGIQFPYFERILGEEIPRERLCNVQIERTEEYTSTIDTSSPERVWLGQDRMLMGIHGLLNRYRSPERIKLLPP